MITKKIFVIIFLIFIGCSSSIRTSNRFVLSKMYVGKYVNIHYIESDDIYFVTTTMGIFRIKDSLHVPDNALCYIRREYSHYDMHPDIAWQLEHQYFTWNGTEEEYRLKKNLDFRRLK